MFPSNWQSGIYPSGSMTETTNDAAEHFLEYDCFGGSDIQEEKPKKKKKKPKTWQEKTYEERENNLRRYFGYD